MYLNPFNQCPLQLNEALHPGVLSTVEESFSFSDWNWQAAIVQSAVTAVVASIVHSCFYLPSPRVLFHRLFQTADEYTQPARARLSRKIMLVYYRIVPGAMAQSIDIHGNTPLHYAVYDGDVSDIQTALDLGVDINAQNLGGGTPLYFARDPAIVALLIQHGANVNAPDTHGQTFLLNATNPDIVEILLNHEADVNAHDAAGNTLLHITGNLDIIELLLKHGANVNAQNIAGKTPLHLTKKPAEFELLLKHEADVTIRCTEGNLPLHDFVSRYRLERSHTTEEREALLVAIRGLSKGGELIDAITTIDEQTPMGKNSALHLTSNKYIAKILIELGADMNLKNRAGEAPLHRAIRLNHFNVVEALIEEGADTTAKNADGHLPLDIFYINLVIPGQEHGIHMAIPEYLLLRGADVNAKDSNKNTLLLRYLRTPLAHVVTEELCESLSPLLTHPTLEVNAVDSFGHTALDYLIKHFIVRQENSSFQNVVRLFLQRGAKAKALDPNTGDNAMHKIVKHYQNENISAILPLLDKNCPELRDQLNNEGLTPQAVALQLEKVRAISYFQAT